MNIEEFNLAYKQFKDADKISINCDYPDHVGDRQRVIGKQPAKRNILKNNGQCFICRDCMMKHKNPMIVKSQSRQTDEIIQVECIDPNHVGNRIREMKLSAYFGELKQPYQQICKSCAQRGKTLSNEQKEKISQTLTGRQLTEDHKKKIGLAAS